MRSVTSLCVGALCVAVLCCLSGCEAGAPLNGDTERAMLQEPEAVPPALPDQPTFGTPAAAVAALYEAAVARDLPGMARIVGLPPQDVVTGDADRDARQLERFVTAHDERLDIVADGDARARVFIGRDAYPLASALVRNGDRWLFDSAGGRAELMARVIGENELATIAVCRAYVRAQYEYYAEDRDDDDVLQYAERLASTPGRRDGLYWPTTGDEPPSPLGSLVAEALARGYLGGDPNRLDAPKPYHGYLFRILTAQGENAPGGRYDYRVNGRMLAGFALVAQPARWGRSGIMTFLVGANGKVYEKDLGAETAALAAAIASYDPDGSWALVEE